VIVRKDGQSAQPKWQPFRSEFIADQLRLRLVKLLSQVERDRVLERVQVVLERMLGDLAQPIPASVARDRKWERNRVYIEAAAIRANVESALKWSGENLDNPADRARHRSAHALYALATTGASWRVGDAVAWLDDNYRLGRPAAQQSAPSNRIAWNPPPLELPTMPLTVVKNFRPDRGHSQSLYAGTDAHVELTAGPDIVEEVAVARRRPTQDFKVEKLHNKVYAVLAGRTRQAQLADGISAWVLWSLVGQTVVRSSQISALVVDCLRRSDPIAYLRWVVVGKELTVEQIHEEAVNLLKYPSPILQFRHDSTPAILPVILPGGGVDVVKHDHPA